MKVIYNEQYGGYGLSTEALYLFTQRVANAKLFEYDIPAYGRGIDNQYDVRKIPRHHPILVQIVEELGPAANGENAKLAIGHATRLYRIGDYDGKEWVITPEDKHEWFDTMRDDRELVVA